MFDNNLKASSQPYRLIEIKYHMRGIPDQTYKDCIDWQWIIQEPRKLIGPVIIPTWTGRWIYHAYVLNQPKILGDCKLYEGTYKVRYDWK